MTTASSLDACSFLFLDSLTFVVVTVDLPLTVQETLVGGEAVLVGARDLAGLKTGARVASLLPRGARSALVLRVSWTSGIC